MKDNIVGWSGIPSSYKITTTREKALQTWQVLLQNKFLAYYEARKWMVLTQLQTRLREAQSLARLVVRRVLESAREISYKKLLLALLPFLSYLLVFKFYSEIRHLTHFDVTRKPNYRILATIEHRLFFSFPHRLLSRLANPVFDVLAAVPYLAHFPLPFLFAAYLAGHHKKRAALYPFVWCAGWVNLIAVVIQLVFPTAPPWFTDSAVLDQNGAVVYEMPNEAGFRRLDRFMHMHVFHSIYAASPVKFGAFPSLHVAWPVVILLNHPWFGRKFAMLHVLWISLAALYTTHHYLIDVLAGVALAVVVRVCMLKLCSPFAELDESRTGENGNGTGAKLKAHFAAGPEGIV